jgi:NAD-dependent SIR2 family protein deacetylase
MAMELSSGTFKKLYHKSEQIVVVSGAGISAEVCGVSTYLIRHIEHNQDK